MIRIRLVIICCLFAITCVRAQAPVVDFSASTTAGCGPLSVHFEDQSTNKPTSWAWDFGNGQISSVQSPNALFSTPGTYTITLIAKNASGASSITKTDFITVYAYPAVKFTASSTLTCAPSAVYFTDQSTPGQGAIVSWDWDFGNGQKANAPNPSTTYNAAGFYNVSLKVVNSGGCSATYNAPRYVRVVSGVQPDFTWSQTSGSCSAPFDINFINQTSGPGTLTYSWDLGNGNTSNQTNPSTNYPSNNNYTIKLTATSSFGCQGSTTKTVAFQTSAPVITSSDNACLNSPITFQNGSTPAPISQTWDFGDGTSSNLPNPSKTYTATGPYTVTLTNVYAACTASSTKTINVGTSIPAQFTSDKTGGCKPSTTINFTDQTTGGIGWLWDFGDGTTSTSQNPSHTYGALGSYDVSLNVTTNTGCASSLTKVQYIQLGTPTLSLSGSSTQGCVGVPIKPIVNVGAPDGVASYQWTASNATPSSSTDPNPSFTYNTQGTYDLGLKITTKDGCTASQNFAGKVVVGNIVIPDFTAAPTTSCARQPITFTSPNTADTWIWIFGDGTNSQTPTTVRHGYADTGYQDVSLFLTNHGCTQRTTKPKYIYIDAPLAGFSYIINCGDRHKVTFVDTSQLDPTKGAPTYRWTFDDGSPDEFTAAPALHTFPDPLTTVHNVRLIVSQGGCSDTVNTSILLQAVIPSFTVTPTSACKNAQFTLTSTSTPAAAIDSFRWTVNTVTRTTSTGSFTTGIPDTGAHVINLVVKDKGGCLFNAPDQTVQITGPKAQLGPSNGGCRNTPVTLNDLSTAYRTDAINNWFVDFGDGKTQNFNSPPLTHTYKDTGFFDITLAVQDAKGCVDTFRVSSAVRITTATAGFLARDTVYCPNAPVPFLDASKGKNLTWSWNFGDGSPVSSTQNPTHIYTGNAQYYDVSLKVTDGTGCSDSVTYKKYMHIQKPIAAFTIEDSTGICIPMQANFFPAGKYYDSLYWDFGDGTTSTLDTTNHFYNNYGPAGSNFAYKVLLVLQGAGGCRDTATRNVYVYQPFAASSLTFSPNRACDSVTANFTASPPPYTNFAFYFGDGGVDSSGNKNVSHTYRSLGTFAPQLNLWDGSGCIVSINNGGVTVLGSVPIFNRDPKNLCDTGTVSFLGLIVSNDGQAKLAWDFGDGTTITGNPTGTLNDPFLSQSHYYNTPGIKLPTLKVTTNSGCNETYTDTVHVWQTPHPLATVDGPFCAGPIQFHGNLTTPNVDSVSWSWNFNNVASSTDQNPKLIFPPGTFTAYLKTSVAFGCSDTTSLSVLINPLPEIKGPKVVTTPIGIPTALPFTYSPNVTTWLWSPPSYLDCTDCPNPMAVPTFPTTYIVKVVDANNCVNLDTVLVKPICSEENYFVPNTFSPNNDGVNDVFYPRGKGLYNVQSMRIFNRWGQLLFERKDFPANTESNGWNGTTNGKPVPADSYVYIIEVVCNNAQIVQLHGNVTLIR